MDILAEYARGELIIPGGPIDMNLSFPGLALCMRRLNVTMVSNDISPEEAGKLGFGHAPTVQDALDLLPEEVKQGKVAIFPAGGNQPAPERKGLFLIFSLSVDSDVVRARDPMSNPSLFVPCTVDLFLPEIGEACLLVLRKLDLAPVYHPEQTCCGQPAIHAGYVRKATESAKHFIEVFGEDEAVVCPSGSCVCTVKDRYPDLLQDEPDWLRRAEDLAARVYEFSQYLVDVLQVEDVGGAYEGKVAYHESCRVLHGLGVSEQPKKLIQRVKGSELVPMQGAEVCCGFGGEFSTNYPEISEALVSEKAANYIASGADVLVACDPGCLLNIGGYLHRHHPDKAALHIASFLAEAIRDGNR